MNHPNIVLFYGAAESSKQGITCFVSEFIQHGALYEILHEGKGRKELSWWLLGKFLKDCARALVYLHSFNPPLIHRDVKSSNLLVTSLNNPNEDEIHIKLCDFGITRTVDTKMTQR